ncbi:MAG: carbohydrate kinase family protein [Patescibacteria group bacterium]
MFDVITFGSSTRDTFLRLKGENHKIVNNDKFVTGKGLCFPLGSKIEIDNILVSSGGGGINTAATLALQGLKTAYIGQVGDDKRGEALVDELKKLKINTKFIKKDKKHSTAYSIIFSTPSGSGSILVYRGACHFLKKKDIPFQNIKKTKWLYLAPLNGELVNCFGPLVDFAKKNNIKVMANLGKFQIGMDKKKLGKILSKIDILNVNQEEAAILTGIDFEKEKTLFKKFDTMISGLAIMTKGKDGVVASDGKYFWEAKSLSIKPIETTGAGDAFGSGFLAEFIKKENVEQGIRFGIANAISCVSKIGSKNGLLKKGERGSFSKIKVIKKEL